MALTTRIALKSAGGSSEPEDFLSSALGVVFPDDVANQHGDADDTVIYTSPHLPKPLSLDLCEPSSEIERRLFSHHLWNSSLLLAELIERDTLGIEGDIASAAGDGGSAGLGHGVSFDVRGLEVLELGAGTALPSIMAGLLGARRVVVTDYPSPMVIETLKKNVAQNIQPENSPRRAICPSVLVQGHSWGLIEDPDDAASTAFCGENKHAFDRLFVADCLWMSWQHANLRRSIDHFLRDSPEARCWVVAAFHTRRSGMSGFFETSALREANLELEGIWEVDCDGNERAWNWHQEDDITVRKRWLAVGVLKRI